MESNERKDLQAMLEWVINKMFEKYPDIEICWDELREKAADAWYELTGIDVRSRHL